MEFKINYGDGSKPFKASPVSKEEEAKEKIARAKENGLKEINQMREYIKEFAEKAGELAIFDDMVNAIKNDYEQVVTYMYQPLLEGKEIYGMPKEIYDDHRARAIKSLIKKYDSEGGE